MKESMYANKVIRFSEWRGVMGRFARYLAAVTAVLCLASSATAQVGATLRFSVEDELGGPISGAKVTLVDKASGETLEAPTDKAGRAAFDALSGGEYVVKAEAPGFLRLERTVTVTLVGNQAPLRLQLKIAVTEEVSVSAAAPPEERTAASQNADTIGLGNGMLLSMPMQIGTQQVASFIDGFLSPLAAAGDPTIIVDGLEVSSVSVPSAAINNVAVNKNPYSPEYRQLGKARVEIVTENGSRRHFNGNVGVTSTNSGLSARNAFAPTKSGEHKDLAEMGFGGPLGRKLGSFLLSNERLNDQRYQVVNAVTLAGPVNTSVATPLNSTSAMARTDLRLTSADRLSLQYTFVNTKQRNLDVGGLLLPEIGIDRRDTEHRLRASLQSRLSAAFTDDLQVLVQKKRSIEGSPAKGPGINVSGAFEGGFNQSYLDRSTPTLQIRNTVDYFRRNHQIKFGGLMEVSHADLTNAMNYGGIFDFADLEAFSAGRPTAFAISAGNPTVAYRRNDEELFFQDEIKLGSDVSLMTGVRYDAASMIYDRNNVAPRLAVGFAPGQQKTVFRVGTGIFYMRPSDQLQERSLINDGTQSHQIVIENPPYPNPFVGGQNLTVPPSILRLDPNLTTPYQLQTTASVEREVGPGTLFTLEYGHIRGYQMFRARDVNAPPPGTDVRPDPNFETIAQVESTGTLKGSELSFTVKSRIGNVLKISSMYTFSRLTNDASSSFRLPPDSFHLEAERGRADYDIRHKFNFAGVFSLPLGFQVAGVANINSGVPFTIITGSDDNGDGSLNDRPVGVGRNTGQGPGYARLDLRLTKLFFVSRPAWAGKDVPSHVELNLDAFNVFNKKNLGPPVNVVSSRFFGQSNTALDPRIVQLSLKYFF
jgi:hypothetical protein